MYINERILAEMIKDAMKENAPKIYAELTEEGTLDEVAKMRAEAAMETYYELADIARTKAATSNKETMERVREHTMANRQAAEIAIAQATEFPNET
jgi:hypothetical protein